MAKRALRNETSTQKAKKQLEPMMIPPTDFQPPQVPTIPNLANEIQETAQSIDSVLEILKYAWTRPMKVSSVGRLAVDTVKVLEMRRKLLLMPSNYTESMKAQKPKDDPLEGDFEPLD